MSDHLQPGTPQPSAANLRVDAHPDADQLNAFLEDALSGYERDQTLAHLAVCPLCRQIISLANLDVDLPAPVPVAPAARPWFTTWRLAWPIAAFAATVLIALNIHRPTVPELGAQNSAVAKADFPPSPEPQAPPSATEAPAPTRLPSPTSVQPMPSPPVLAEASAAALSQKAPAIPAAVLAPPPAAATAGAVSPPKPAVPPQAAPRSLDAFANQDTTAAAQRESNQVTGAAPAIALTIPTAQLPAPLPLPHPLPNGLATLSISNASGKTLAIDSAHHVFLTEDGGQHWRTILTPWNGQAIRVDLAVKPAIAQAKSNAVFGGMARSMVAAAAPARPAPGTATLSGIVTDPDSARIPNANIKITPAAGAATTYRASTVAGGAGEYTLPGIPPGTYTVTATKTGFTTDSMDRTLTANKSEIANFALTVGSASEVITVQSCGSCSIDDLNAMVGKTATLSQPPLPLFTITTDRNETWSSPDGITWTRNNPPQK